MMVVKVRMVIRPVPKYLQRVLDANKTGEEGRKEGRGFQRWQHLLVLFSTIHIAGKNIHTQDVAIFFCNLIFSLKIYSTHTAHTQKQSRNVRVPQHCCASGVNRGLRQTRPSVCVCVCSPDIDRPRTIASGPRSLALCL